jgi:hypothetical protein
MARTNFVRSACLIIATGCVAGGTAQAAAPVDSSSARLRPSRHLDRFGRTLEDICPERVLNQRRCFAQRFVHDDASALSAPAPDVRPAAPSADPSCQSAGGGGGNTPFTGAMAPKDVLAAYQLPASTKADGKIVALVELPSVHGMADVNAYRKEYGIPALPACPVDASGVPTPGGTACFARVGEDGTTRSVTSVDCAGWSGETGLDMDMVSAACPDCSIVLVEANNTNDLDPMNSIAATVVGAAAASNSWGGPETGRDDASFYASPDILTFAASGDSGYINEALGRLTGTSFPSSAPTVIAVGGTTLRETGGQYSEVVWNDAAGQGAPFGGGDLGAGGSGCSAEFSRPAWQVASGFTFGKCSERATVDLSAAAQFEPTGAGGGIAAYDIDDGGWNSVVGTSAATPLVAAIMVRLGLAGKDNHQLFYDHIAAFNDITSGDNDNDALCSDVMCTAGKGWDGPTGLGSPNGERLYALVDPGFNADAGAATPLDASADAARDAAPSTGGASAADGGGRSTVSEDDAGFDAGEGEAGCPSASDCPDASVDTSDVFPGGSKTGCACSSTLASPWSGGAGAASALAIGLAALALRRRAARRARPSTSAK